MSKRYFGWKKDPFDPKAWEFKPRLLVVPPPSVILDKYRMPVLNQDGVGACVGFGIDGILTAELIKSELFVPVDKQTFSPTDIYNGGRYIDGTLRWDVGTYASSALEWLRLKKCLPYTYWPFNGFETNSRPSKLDQYAEPWPLSSYTPLTIGYFRVVDGADGIMQAIASQHCVAIGVPWPDRWMNSKNGQLATPKSSDSIAGGHEVFLYGYDNDKQLFYGQNSWGTSVWSYSGKVVPKGCFTMPFASLPWFKKNGGYDAHIVNVDWKLQPPTPPAASVQVKVSTDSGQSWQDFIQKVSSKLLVEVA